jgi:ABC-type transporter Mla maintaining outer membrane lipid asymmetry ATPase subunit MlaF
MAGVQANEIWETTVMTESRAAIEIHGLSKAFGEVVALDGLELRIERGTVFGSGMTRCTGVM